MRLAGTLGARISQQPEVVSFGVAVVPGYQNPLRDVSGLVPERIDMGVDFGGSGPVYAARVETQGQDTVVSIIPVASALTTISLPPVRDSYDAVSP